MDLNFFMQQFRKRAETDEAFRAELQNDPEGVFFRETGMTAAKFMESRQGSLSEEELQGVAGGAGDPGLGGRLRCECGFTAWDLYDMVRHAGQCRG